MTMTCLKKSFILFLLGALSVFAQNKPAAAPWHEKDAIARVRFLVYAKRSPALFVPIPEELAQETKYVAAIDDRGNRLESVPFFQDGVMIGAAVNAVKLTAPGGTPPNINPNASLYLLKEPPKENPPWTGVPVRVHRHAQTLTTRAFTAPEMLRLFANLKQRRNQLPPIPTTNFGLIPDGHPRWLQPPEQTYGVSVFTWEGFWNVEKPQTVRFGGNQTHVAWTVLLDGKPVANWQDTENVEFRKEGGRFGAAVDVKPGLHALQFLVVQCLNQPIPQLLIKDAQDKEGVGAQPTGLFPMRRSPILGVEVNGQPDASVIITIFEEQGFYFQQMDESIVSYRLSEDASAELLPLDSTRQSPKINNHAICAGTGYPTIKLNTPKANYTFKGFARWTQGVAANFYAHIGELTPLVRHGDNLKGNIRVQWPESVPVELHGFLNVHAQLEKADGISGELITTTTADHETFQFSLPVTDDATAIVFTSDFAGATPFPPLTVKILRSKDANCPVVAQGTSLFENDKADACRVAFVADSLPDATQETPSIAYPDSLFILDDFIATANAPQANLLPETLLSEYFQHKPLTQITHATVHCPQGTDDEIAVLANLSTLVGLKPKTALLSIGCKPLKAGLGPLAATDQILFVAQVCKANGIQPIFMTLPQLPGISVEESRLAALYLKELAVRTGTPIIDLYAQALLGHVNTSEWYLADHSISIPTLNNAGRAWVIQHTASRLAKLFQ
ncbi:MAG: hypothetical protein IKP58_16375 [Victivallales bacterium]|nr:hypothetical protein [Victivallales bacterium]